MKRTIFAYVVSVLILCVLPDAYAQNSWTGYNSPQGLQIRRNPGPCDEIKKESINLWIGQCPGRREGMGYLIFIGATDIEIHQMTYKAGGPCSERSLRSSTSGPAATPRTNAS